MRKWLRIYRNCLIKTWLEIYKFVVNETKGFVLLVGSTIANQTTQFETEFVPKMKYVVLHSPFILKSKQTQNVLHKFGWLD